MSNGQLTFVAVGTLVVHLLILAGAVMRRQPALAFGLNLAVAGLVLIALALDLKWLRTPVDWQVAGLAAFDLLAAAAAVLALQGYRPAALASWAVFALHLLASALAVAFVLTFKINRLI